MSFDRHLYEILLISATFPNELFEILITSTVESIEIIKIVFYYPNDYVNPNVYHILHTSYSTYK